MENDFEHELAKAISNAETAEVVCVIFPLISQCLVYDSRNGPEDPPRITVSPPLGSAERRLRHVNQSRPHLRHARALAVIPWIGSITTMVGSDVWKMLEDRMTGSGFDSAQQHCEEALGELLRCERQSIISMIRGNGPFHTLWSRE
jgi:hypothetical protein